MLSRSSIFPGVAGPVVTVVMDGIGQRSATAGNAVRDAHTPTLDRLFARYPHTLLKAHGTAVGMPSDEDMGNSEVGHNALGSGQVYAQGAALVNDAIAGGSLFAGAAWGEIVANVLASGGTLHFLGLFSDGNVHSHIEHLKALITAARGAGVRRVRVHALLDGRDVPATSALDYVLPFEQFLAGLRSESFDARIASGGGRMYITMDRYEADWDMVARGWATHVLGEGRRFASAAEAIDTLRSEKPGCRRPGPAGLRDRLRRRAARSDRGRRLGGVLQLPRRPRDRDLARFHRGGFHAVRARPRAAGVLRRHDAVRRRPADPAPLPGRAAGDPRHHGRVPQRRRRLAARDLGNAEVRPRDLFLERQPQREFRRAPRDARSRSPRTACRSRSGRG